MKVINDRLVNKNFEKFLGSVEDHRSRLILILLNEHFERGKKTSKQRTVLRFCGRFTSLN